MFPLWIPLTDFHSHLYSPLTSRILFMAVHAFIFSISKVRCSHFLLLLCECVHSPCHRWWQAHKSEYFFTARLNYSTLTIALHLAHTRTVHTHTHTLQRLEQGRSERLTFTYNLFMLHTVIWHNWEKVNFLSPQGVAAVYDFKITACYQIVFPIASFRAPNEKVEPPKVWYGIINAFLCTR